MSANVHIYLTDWCPYCQRAKALLTRKRVSFTEVDVDARPELRTWLVSASGQRTVPQIFINGAPVGGFSELDALERRGTLDRLLAAEPASDGPVLPV